jgi:hypothetical protein
MNVTLAFTLGLLIGTALTSWFFIRSRAEVTAGILKNLLTEQGYEVKDKKIVPVSTEGATE